MRLSAAMVGKTALYGAKSGDLLENVPIDTQAPPDSIE